MIPLILYVLSGLDLRYIGRSEFSLGRLTKPCAYISIAWLLLSFIQGCLPLTEFNGSFAYADGREFKVLMQTMLTDRSGQGGNKLPANGRWWYDRCPTGFVVPLW